MSSLSWGVGDFLGGLQSRRRSLLVVLVVTQTVGLLLAVAIVAVRGQGPPAGAAWVGWAVGGGLAGVVGIGTFYRGLATGNMGVVAPISSAAAVVPLVVAVASGERPHALQWTGIVVAICGVVLASREDDEAGGARVAAGAGLAVVAALGFGLFFVGLERASKADAVWAILVARMASTGTLWAIALARRTALPRHPAELRSLLPVGVLDTGANLMFALATTQGLLSVVAVLGSVYPVVTVLLAHLVLHERLLLVQRIGALGALAGAALISAG
jgi:drug/metabolite transporter (DMT)-like permease